MYYPTKNPLTSEEIKELIVYNHLNLPIANHLKYQALELTKFLQPIQGGR